MKSRYDSSPRKPGEWRTSEQLVQAKIDALLWRAEWRHRKIRGEEEQEKAAKTPKTPPAPQVAPHRGELQDRANFASGIARAEFGRFYRHGKLDRKPAKQAKALDEGRPNGKRANGAKAPGAAPEVRKHNGGTPRP